jgi:hypothetical protein
VAAVVLTAVVAASCASDGEPAATSAPTTSIDLVTGEVPPPVEPPPAELSAAQLGGLRFTDVTDVAGLDRERSTRELLGEDGMTGPVSVVDVDGDDLPDLFLPRTGDVNSLYRNDGDGTFTDVAAEAGLLGPNPQFGTGPTVFFDADADGDQDAYLAAVGAESDRLYRNDGTGRFTDVTVESGVFQPPPTRLRNGDQVHGLDVADVDGDGDLDLVVVQWDTAVPENAANAGAQRQAASGDQRLDRFGDICAGTAEIRSRGIPRVPGEVPNRSRLWINDGDGTFTDGTAAWGVDFTQILGFTPVLADVDGDRWPDLTITGDACTSQLYRNVDGRRFENVTASAGVGTDENGMGSVVTDVTGDGAPDWLITSISFPTEARVCPVLSTINGCSGNRLFVNDGGGRFVDETDRWGLRDSGWGWGAAVEDFGNDGTRDVVITNGFGEVDARRPEGRSFTRDYFTYFLDDPTRFWVRTGDRFTEASAAIGLDHRGIGVGLAPFDLEGDGDLDLVIVESEDAPVLYRNDTPARRWLRVRLDDPSSPGNRSALGAVVTVTPQEGADPVVTEVSTGGSYESQREPVVHVGLADVARVASVEVRWPGADEPQVLRDVAADQVLTVVRSPVG